MQQNPTFLQKALFAVGALVLLALGTQWFTINWGRVENGQTSTINVTGQAKDMQANQIATFTAGVSVNNVDREAAVEAANAQMTQLVNAVKEFGIAAEDIKTENLSVYEYMGPAEIMPMERPAIEPMIYPPVTQPTEKQWQATNNVTITLRDLSRASDLASMLTGMNAVNVYGPNFTTDDTSELDAVLLQEAMADARRKADVLLEGTGQRVLRVINVFENDISYPYMYRDMAVSASSAEGANTPVEPGSETVYKTVSVTFEISR